MSNKSQQAIELFKQGYNCAQSVFAAFCEDLNLDFETALKLASSFGGGMGKAGEVCGAVSSCIMVLGDKCAPDDPRDAELKQEFYKKVKQILDEFAAVEGTYICRELTAVDKSGCEGYVKTAADILEKYL